MSKPNRTCLFDLDVDGTLAFSRSYSNKLAIAHRIVDIIQSLVSVSSHNHVLLNGLQCLYEVIGLLLVSKSFFSGPLGKVCSLNAFQFHGRFRFHCARLAAPPTQKDENIHYSSLSRPSNYRPLHNF